MTNASVLLAKFHTLHSMNLANMVIPLVFSRKWTTALSFTTLATNNVAPEYCRPVGVSAVVVSLEFVPATKRFAPAARTLAHEQI